MICLVLWYIKLVGNLIPNPVYTSILIIKSLVWFGFMAYCRLFNAKPFFKYILNIYDFCDGLMA